MSKTITTKTLTIGLVAPSSKVPEVEFALGRKALEKEGFDLQVHPQCLKEHLFFAGTDEERARAFFEYAHDPRIEVLWSARGGYGAIRILPFLEKWTVQKGIPAKKLFVGYSDATALLEFVRTRWGWPVLHAPMPGIRAFCRLTKVERETMLHWIRSGIRGRKTPMPWGKKKLKFVGKAPQRAIQGEVMGGNLTVWASLLGTPFAPRRNQGDGKILFFEDVGESLYRLDRILQQLRLAGGLEGAKAIVLGNFEGCNDIPPPVLARAPSAKALQRVLAHPKPEELAPLRPKLDADRWIPRLFQEIGDEFGVPVAYGLPVGHGPGHASLPFGTYRLGKDGSFELLNWDWRG
jgi:muramoyltetrapeptide carboxypeptidase